MMLFGTLLEYYLSINIDNYGFGRRIANAVKYILGIERKDGDFDSFEFAPADAPHLRQLAKTAKKGCSQHHYSFGQRVADK